MSNVDSYFSQIGSVESAKFRINRCVQIKLRVILLVMQKLDFRLSGNVFSSHIHTAHILMKYDRRTDIYDCRP